MIWNIAEKKMSREIYLIALVCLFSAFASCGKTGKEKYFTGTIEYAYSYTSDSLNADSLARVRPAKGSFRYDTINYQSQFIGQDTETYYYSGVRNKCLQETHSLINFLCIDYNGVTDSVLSTSLYDTDEKVLGYSCKILEMQKSNSWVKYYVSNELKIAPATYEKHKSYNWDIYGEKANGGLILKSEHRFKNFVMKGVATNVKAYPGDFSALEMDEKRMDEMCNAKN